VITWMAGQIRRHAVSYLALFFALGGTSWAVSERKPSKPTFVQGGGQILTGSLTASPFRGPFIKPPDPPRRVLDIPGFGDVQMTYCYRQSAGDLIPGVVLQNTSGVRLDSPSGPVPRGKPLDFRLGFGNNITTTQVAKGTGKRRTVATITVSTFGRADAGDQCRTQAQAIVQQRRPRRYNVIPKK
jgi:hypothetical protein